MISWLKWCIVCSAIFKAAVFPAAAEVGMSYEEWYEEFRREAVQKGISAQVLDKAFAEIKPIPAVISSDRKQPELRKDFQSYIDNAINALRVRRAQNLIKTHQELFDSVAQKYGVPTNYLVAFWGMETDFGNSMGRYPIVGALATLAYDTRRPAFFRSELLNSMRLIQAGLAPEKMNGSWAGAMGNFQFMPSTFLEYGTDYDGDGIVDLWNSLPDAVASAANYLSNEGWDKSLPWGREVFLPKKFDWNLIEQKKTIQQWMNEGVKFPKNIELTEPLSTTAELFIPAGVQGPAFLVYSNFRVIMRWNNSVLYAIAVGHLADRVSGHPPFIRKYADKSAFFSLEEALEVQKILAELNLYNGEIDGVLGRKSREAVRKFQIMYDLPGDGFANHSLLNFMRLVMNGEVEREKLTFDEIVEMQKILSKGQYYKGPIDGKLGKTTEKGIELYKIVYGIQSKNINRRLLEKMRVQYFRNLENGEIEPLVKEFRKQEDRLQREEMEKRKERERKRALDKKKKAAQKAKQQPVPQKTVSGKKNTTSVSKNTKKNSSFCSGCRRVKSSCTN